MAAAMSPRPSSGFDLRTTAPYPIRLDLSTCSSVQFNHKPELADPKRAQASIQAASNGNQVILSLKDGSDRYRYEGRRHKDNNTYVLVLDQQGRDFVLEKVDSSYAFNLTKAPWETDSTVLQENHPQLDSALDDEDDMMIDDDDGGVSLSAEADADNPFDFRHYLDAPASPSPQIQPTKAASANTPALSQNSTRTNTPLTKSTRKQTTAFAPKVPPKPKAKPKPVDRKPEPPASERLPSPPPQQRRQEREEIDVPSVRLDRRASNRIALPPKPPPKKREMQDLSLDNGGDDSGDLILEGFEPSRTSYHAKSTLGLGLSGDFGGGPRSLRSAASSPAGSHINSPAQRLHSPMDDDNDHDQSENEDIEMDDGGGQQEEVESDVDEDHDVATLELPSPARVRRPSVSGHAATDEMDEFDLEEQMRLELEGGLEEDGPRQAESDEESEEE